MAEKVTILLPMLPPSLNVYRNEHWKKQRGEEKTWRDFITVKWAEIGRPEFKAVKITLIFTFPDKRQRDLDNYLATGSKLVGDAVKGRFIPDDGPENLISWSFIFEFGDAPQTKVIIDAVGQRDEEWQRPTCNLYENCNTPLCPLDQTSLKGIWYPEEEICRSRTYGNLPWIQAQRKLSRVAASGFFTVEMMIRLAVIRKGITGLDPNIPEQQQLRSWLQNRTAKTDMSPKARPDRTSHLKNFRFKKQVGGRLERHFKTGREGVP